MKKTGSILLIIILSGCLFFPVACTDDVLDQVSTTDMAGSEFWKTEEDATTALMGAYSYVRGLFHRDYYFDGHGDYVRILDGSGQLSTNETNITRGGAAYRLGCYFPDPIWNIGARFDNYYKFSYGGIHRANYVIDNVAKMLPDATPASKEKLETVIGEARLLRGMIYFRLISMWGDIPYIGHIVYDNSEVAELARTPIAVIKDSILADFTYAFEKLPAKAAQTGRASKPAALAFRGKFLLYWASWNKYGWPELDTFTPNQEEALKSFSAAAKDFKSVIDDYGLNLFRGGEPGEWGEMGKADVLPNYYYLFIPSTANSNVDGEMIFYFTHGGPGSGQGDPYVRDFAGRSIENSQACVTPNYRLADRYQSIETGEFMEKLIPMNPTNPNARTAKNSAINPESYAGRDYRMKATMLWDYEMSVGLSALKETGWVPYIYKTWGVPVTINGTKYTSYSTDINNFSGYLFRKFVRNYGGAGRDEGDLNWPVIRLADVLLMYAEADNEINGPQEYAINLVNRVRHRGNLPALSPQKTANKEVFFDAIEQERIVELIAEGHRAFDLRRWRRIEKAWEAENGGQPIQPGSSGIWLLDTHGAKPQGFFINPTELDLQRGYIFKIPQEERDRNPNLTQNKPWM
jgi:hypothetical protein